MSVEARKRLEELATWPKLRALELLRSIESQSFATLPFLAISAEEWASASEEVIRTILDAHLGPIVVARSCAALEDTFAREPPGFFDSVLDVKTNATDLRWAIEKVIASYSRRSMTDALPHKVVIQQQLLMPSLCGVCRVGPVKGDYIDIDCDSSLGRTDAVTGGIKAKRVSISPCIDLLPAPWLQIRRCADQLRDHFPAPFFIEFALSAAGMPTVFQIRSDRRSQATSDTSVPPRCEELNDAATIIEKFGPLSVMADWNPAEMLGLRPMPLDVSLYDELVMSGAWADGRMSIGWREPSDRSLMTVVADRPYVKVALSLESLLPQGLPHRLADRLVRDRLAVLSANRQLHDKVEFRLMWSAFAFNHEAVDRDLRERGFSPEEVKQLFAALRTVTRKALEDAPRLLEADRCGIAHLQAQRKSLASTAARATPVEAAQAIRTAMAMCKTHGTVPFSRQARLAFSFRYMINHLVESGSVQADAVASWQSRLNTVTRQLSRDLARVQNGKTTERFFFDRYGHLRPSTYNLESLRYDERAMPSGEQPENTPGRPRCPGKSPRLAEILEELGTTCSQSQFWTAAAGAYKGREEIKFAFTALLSDILRTLAEIAKAAGLEKRDLRCLRINDLLSAMEQANSWHDFGRRVAVWPLVPVPLWPRLKLSDVIFSSCDLHVVSEPEIRPTFVGQQVVSGVPCQINGDSSFELGSLAGNIIAIETPDPGYDWVFANRIAGLITAYGGEFSHMGLRCAEFGIPAALGCGPTLFTSAVTAAELKLDPTAGELWADGERLLTQ